MRTPTSLADLAPLTRVVAVRNAELTVHSLSLAQFAGLMARFRALRPLLDGRDLVEGILGGGAEALDAVLACALAETEAAVRAARLSAPEQLAVLTACLELTLPEEDAALGELLARLARLWARGGGLLSGLPSSSG